MRTTGGPGDDNHHWLSKLNCIWESSKKQGLGSFQHLSSPRIMIYSILSTSAGQENDEITGIHLLKQEYLTQIKEGCFLFCIPPEVSGETSETGLTCVMTLTFVQFSLIFLFPTSTFCSSTQVNSLPIQQRSFSTFALYLMFCQTVSL